MLKFLTISKPVLEEDWLNFFLKKDLEWAKKTFALRGTTFDHLGLLDNRQLPEAGLIHPSIDMINPYCFVVCLDIERKILYAEQDNLGKFQTHQGENVLFFKNPPIHNDLQLIWEDANQVSYYRKMDQECLKKRWGIKNALALQMSQFQGHFFEETNQLQNPVIYFLKEVSQSIIDSTPSDWMNPIIVQFSVEGSETQNMPSDAINVHQVVNKLIEPRALLRIEPLLEDDLDCRLLLWKESQKWIGCESRTPSCIEKLLWGSPKKNADAALDSLPPWMAFLILDKLGGTFFVKGHGSGKTLFQWLPPDDLKPNGKWLADRLIKLWGGTLEMPVQSLPTPIPAPPLLKPWGKKIQFDISIPVNDQDAKQLLISSCKDFLDKWIPACEQQNVIVRPLLKFIYQKILSHTDLANHPVQQTHYGLIQSRKIETGFEIAFDELTFLARFGKQFLSPESPISIELPAPCVNHKQELLDIIYSIHNTHRTFLQTILQQRQSLGDQKMTIEVIFGWWNQWWQTLFEHPNDVFIDFVFREDSRVGYARIGYAHIGNVPAYLQLEQNGNIPIHSPCENMRF
jgi:hypothetical protein